MIESVAAADRHTRLGDPEMHPGHPEAPSNLPVLPFVLCLVLGLACASTLSAQPHGGSGGSPFSLQCPVGEVLAGITARVGTFVDSIEVLCVRVERASRNSVAWTGGHASRGRAGGTGGGPVTLRCDEGWAVSGIHGRADDLVDSLGLICSPLSGAGGSAMRGPSGGSGGTAFSDPSLEGDVGLGFVGRSGNLIDQIELTCGVPAPVTPGGTPEWTLALHTEPTAGATSDTLVHMRTVPLGTWEPPRKVCRYDAIPIGGGAPQSFTEDLSCEGQYFRLQPGAYRLRVAYTFDRPDGSIGDGVVQRGRYEVTLEPHVEVTSLELDPSEPTVGEDVTIRMTIANTSNGTLSRVPWQLLMNAASLRNGAQFDVAPGASFDVPPVTFSAPVGLTEIFGHVDFANELNEAQAERANNTKAVAIMVEPIVSPPPPASALPTPIIVPPGTIRNVGPRFEFSYTICNVIPAATYVPVASGWTAGFAGVANSDYLPGAFNSDGSLLRPPCPTTLSARAGLKPGLAHGPRPVCGTERRSFRVDAILGALRATSAVFVFTVRGDVPCPP